MALRTVGVRLVAEIGAFKQGMRDSAASVRGLNAEIDKAARAGGLNEVADQARNMGLAFVAGFALIVRSAAQFEKAMSNVDAATHASAQELEQLSAAALQAGRDTSFSATQAAQGIEELAKAGVSTADILGGGLKGALDLAAAGQIEVAEAAETAASALTQFRLRGTDVSHVADLLAAGAGKAQGSVRDMSQALNQGGLVASQMGLSIEETVGTLTAFASAGLLGSDSGTSFKTMLLRLAAPTDVATAKMKELGISAFDAQGEFIGMAAFAGNLRESLSGLSQEQQLAAMTIIFGQDAIRAASITYQQGQSGIQGWIDKTDDAGFAADTAARKTDNLVGDIERLTGELESLAISSGGGASQGLRALVQMAEALVAQLGKMDPVLATTAVMLAGLGGAGLLAFSAFIRIRSAGADALSQLSAMGPAGDRAAKGLSRAAHWAGRAAIAFAALQVLGALISQFQDELEPQLGAMSKGLEEWSRTGVLAGEAARVLGDSMQDLNVGLKFLADTDNSRRAWVRGLQDQLEALIPGLDGTNTSLAKTRERVGAIDSALASLVQGGSADRAAAIFTRLAREQAAHGVSTEELKALFPGYAAALEEAAAAGDGLNKTHEEAAVNAAILDGGLAGLVEQAGSLKGAFDKLNGAAISFAEAEIDVEAAIDDLTASFKENGKTLDINTEKGRENKQGLLDVVKAAIEAAQAKFDETGSLQDANTVYGRYIEQLRASMIAAGHNKAEVDKLLAAYAKMPPMVGTQVHTPGLETAISRVRKLQEELNKLIGKATIRIGVEGGRGGHLERRHGGITMHARDGLLRQADIFPPKTPARFAFAEPETGGEAFVPRFGDAQRSLGIVDTAARWYGHTIMPTGFSGGGGGGAIQLTVRVDGRVQVEGTGVLSGLRDEIELKGGDVQKVLGRR